MRALPSGRMAFAVLLVASLSLISSCTSTGSAENRQPRSLDVVRVPQDATLSEAGDLVAEGGLIVISDGVYNEGLAVSANDVTVRGEDRNRVILDGELTRQQGVVSTGAGFTVENLTVRNFLQNGILITGMTDSDGAGIARGPDGYAPTDVPPPVPGYLVQYVTAENNGLYGIYAFNRTAGVITQNLASGSSDSGIYVGQCENCDATVTENTLVSNAAGVELANASNVVIAENRITDNRIGVSVLSNYLEAHGPTRSVRIIGNVIADNNETNTPEHAAGAFGIGIGLSGTVDAEVSRNRIARNGAVGLWVTSSEDFEPHGNRVSENVWDQNATDVVFSPSPRAAGRDNCIAVDSSVTVLPLELPSSCSGPTPIAPFVLPPAPAGIAFSRVPLPSPRKSMPLSSASASPPRSLDVDRLGVPNEDLLGGDAP